MPTMTREQAQELLSPYYPSFWAAIRQAFTRYFEINRDELGTIHDRTKACYINDLAVRNLTDMIPEATWQHTRGQRRMWLAGVTCLRVKKLNRNLHPQNIATQAQFDFYDGLVSLQSRFENMPPVAPLFLGFTMNRTKTAPERVFIVCADGVLNQRQGYPRPLENIRPRIVWAIEVPDAGQLLRSTPLLPEQPRQPETPGLRRVRTGSPTTVRRPPLKEVR